MAELPFLILAAQRRPLCKSIKVLWLQLQPSLIYSKQQLKEREREEEEEEMEIEKKKGMEIEKNKRRRDLEAPVMPLGMWIARYWPVCMFSKLSWAFSLSWMLFLHRSREI